MPPAVTKTPLAEVMRFTPGPHNPNPPPGWRWARARWLREESKYARKQHEDPWVLQALKFQQAFQKAGTLASLQRLASRCAPLYAAWDYQQREDGSPRWGLEAYLVSGAAPAFIAEKLRLPVEIIICYSKLFFDVAGRTQHRDYILNEVIGAAAHRGIRERQYDILWKILANYMGPASVSAIMSRGMSNGASRPTSAEQVPAAYQTMIRGMLDHKAAAAMATMSVEYNQEIIFTLWGKLVEIERKQGNGAGGTNNLFMQNVHTTVRDFGFQLGVLASPVSISHIGSGVELRASDQARQAIGLLPADDSFGIVDFPEAKDGRQDR